MKGFVLAILATFVACSVGLPSLPVVRFSVYENEDVVINRPRLTNYVYKNCAPTDKEIFNLISLTFSPDPLSFPGPLNVSFSGVATSMVDAPLKAEVYLGKKMGNAWIKIPCIGEIGSCTYDDVCDLLSNIGECPQEFVDNNIPCKCPFHAGTYKLPVASFDVEAAIFPPGDYHAQANLTYNGNLVGCYELYATFE